MLMQSAPMNLAVGVGGRPISEGMRRRAQRRRPHRVPCEVWLRDNITGERRVLAGQTVNLSATGIAVQVGETVACGTTVEALMLPALSTPLRVSGAVRHVRRVLTGTFELGIETWPADAATN